MSKNLLYNDVLSIINMFVGDMTFRRNKQNKLSISINCNNCGKNTRYTDNSYFDKITIPDGLIEINKNGEIHKTHFTHMFENTSSDNIFGVVMIDGEVVDYKKYIIKHGEKESIPSSQRYSIEWDKQPDNVKIYADQTKSHFLYHRLLSNSGCRCNVCRKIKNESFKDVWEDLTEIPYDNISDKVICCYKCRKTKKNKPFIKFSHKY